MPCFRRVKVSKGRSREINLEATVIITGDSDLVQGAGGANWLFMRVELTEFPDEMVMGYKRGKEINEGRKEKMMKEMGKERKKKEKWRHQALDNWNTEL